MTLNRKNIDKSELIPNFEIVPDGILEIVTKQSEGWGYIKESHH
jgi:intracellular sulfur oxidation DsrE/DsrF family protein